MTLGDYIRNRRLSLAGQELLNQESKLLDVATKYQYETQESFSKAFLRFHEVNPSDVQRRNGTPKVFHPLTITINIQGGIDMSINSKKFTLAEYSIYELDNKINGEEVPLLFKKEIINLPNALLVGRKVTYPIDKQGVAVEDGGNPPLNLLWLEYDKDGTREWLMQNRDSMFIDAALGYYYDINVNGSGTFSYIVGSYMKPDTVIPNGLDYCEVPASEFVVCWYRYKENEDDIWAVAHSTVENYMKDIGYVGNGGCSELYPFDENNDGYQILGYLIAGEKEQS